MKLKKLLAVLCACALFFALAIPAFAAPAGPQGLGLDLNGEVAEGDEDLDIAVSVLYTIDKLYVNPYGLPFTIADKPVNGDQATKIKGGTVTDGWFSATAAIKNNSTSALPVSVTITTTPQNGGVRVVDDADDAKNNYPNYNCLYGKFQITSATLVSGVITPTNWTLADSTGGTGAMHELAIPSTANPVTAAQRTGFTLAAATTSGVGNAATTTPGYAAFRISGGAVICSQDASAGDASNGSIANVWPEEDTVDMSIAFSFGS